MVVPVPTSIEDSEDRMIIRLDPGGPIDLEGLGASFAALARFYAAWSHDELVIDKWFALQARSSLPRTPSRVRILTSHPAFCRNPGIGHLGARHLRDPVVRPWQERIASSWPQTAAVSNQLYLVPRGSLSCASVALSTKPGEPTPTVPSGSAE